MTPKVLLILETIDNKLGQPPDDLIYFAEKLLPDGHSEIVFVIAGQDIHLQAMKIAEMTGIDVIAIENDRLLLPNPELLSSGIHKIINEVNPLYICLHHTPRSCHTAASLSHVLHFPLITNIESLKRRGNTIIFGRSIFNGKLIMDIQGQSNQTILTVIPGAFDNTKTKRSPSKAGKVTVRNISDETSGFVPLKILSTDDSDSSLEEADVIVSVGLGAEKAENLDLVKNFASLLKNSAVGASRIACDRGWFSHSKQIGATGKRVSPKLYMACGISGSAQHISGIKDSQMIIAINRDPRAAIFSVADYGIVEDLTTFLSVMIKKMKNE